MNIGSRWNLILTWFGHSSFKIFFHETLLIIDPVRKNDLLQTTLEPKKEHDPTAVLVTHEHWDHCDPDTIMELSSWSTMIYGPKSIENPIIHRMTFDSRDMKALNGNKKRIEIVNENDELEINEFIIKCLPAQEGLSYLLIKSDLKLLFMGDSVATSQMIDEHPDVVLFPIWAVYGEEAKLEDFLALAKDSLCIPMHFHTSSLALPNFYVDLRDIEELLPNVNMNILRRDEPFLL